MKQPENHEDDTASTSQKIFEVIEKYFPVLTREYLFDNMCLQEMVHGHLVKQLEMYKANISCFLHEVGKMRDSLRLAFIELAAKNKGLTLIQKFNCATCYLHSNKDSVGKRRLELCPEEAVFIFFNDLYKKVAALKNEALRNRIIRKCIKEIGRTLTNVRELLTELVSIFQDDARQVFLLPVHRRPTKKSSRRIEPAKTLV